MDEQAEDARRRARADPEDPDLRRRLIAARERRGAGLHLALFAGLGGELASLEAILEDARGRGIPELLCLGDLAPEAPDPVLLRRLEESGAERLGGPAEAGLGWPARHRRPGFLAVYGSPADPLGGRVEASWGSYGRTRDLGALFVEPVSVTAVGHPGIPGVLTETFDQLRPGAEPLSYRKRSGRPRWLLHLPRAARSGGWVRYVELHIAAGGEAEVAFRRIRA